MLRCANLVLRVPGRTLCRNLDVTFEPGQVRAILGRNGTGKSTLLHTLAGLTPPAEGSVELELDGAVLPRQARVRSRALGVLLQIEEGTYWGTVAEYVLLGRYPHARAVAGYAREDFTQVQAALEAMRLLDLVQHRFATLSGGERQRARIAQIWAQHPRIYLLDEPLQHLDLAHQAHVLDLFAQRVREERATAIMVLHEPLWITRSCTHALILAGDTSAHGGEAREVLTRERLEHAYGCRLREVGDGAGRSFIPDV